MSEEKIPPLPPIPREEPQTAPPPDYGGRRYVSAEMQRVAESDAPPDPETERAALLAEVKATHARIAELERGQKSLSETDLRHASDISEAITAAREAKAAADSLRVMNDLGANKASAAAAGVEKLDAKAWITLVVALVGSVLGLVRALRGDPAPVPVVVAPQVYAVPSASAVHP